MACLLLKSICFSLVSTVTRTADYRDGATRLSEVSLSQAEVYDQSHLDWKSLELVSGNQANLCKNKK